MCLIAVALRASPRYALIVAANRDEQHGRPSAAADWWSDAADVLGGRDLLAGGSWLAINRAGRLAAVTNYAEPGQGPARRSRGLLVGDYVRGTDPGAVMARVAQRSDEYAAFNMLGFDGDTLHYLSNRAAPQRLEHGVHSLSNHALGADWPKLARAARGLEALLNTNEPTEALFELLATAERSAPPPQSYRESLFIVGPDYGTRASTVVLVDHAGRVQFHERRFDSSGRPAGQSDFEFTIERGGS